MPTPIGHSLAGLALVWSTIPRSVSRCKVTLLGIFAAVSPDFDFLFGFFEGNPNKYHHQFTHSLVYVFTISLILGLLAGQQSRRHYIPIVGIFALLGLTHLFLDAACVDTSAPFGLQVLWPFSHQYFIFPVTPLLDVHRASDSASFFMSLLSWHNFKTASLEIILFAPLVALSYFKVIKNQKYNG